MSWIPDSGFSSRRKRGVFVPNVGIKTKDITDGLSNTIMIGEMQRLIPPSTVPRGENPAYYGPSRTSNDGWALAGCGDVVHHGRSRTRAPTSASREG